jgi:hypothetical protein
MAAALRIAKSEQHRKAEMDPDLFDEIFRDGRFTEERIDAAGVKIMQLAQQDNASARQAARLLESMLVLAIANRLAVTPEGCASHYLDIVRAAFGEPTLLDKVKGEIEDNERSRRDGEK